MSAMHYGDYPEYDVHNFFGFLESQATHEYLLTISNLTFILSRSTAPGSGQFTAHWTGDNGATWEFLKYSIAGCMDFNMFGIPMVGADICGFSTDTTPELCARWMQLGTLYTFARNHHTTDDFLQEPYNLGPTVLETSRIALDLRYSILKYYYSLFVAKNGTGTIFRPVFFEFPADQTLLNMSNNYTDEQFMIGASLMSSPVVEEGVTYTITWFPQARWYDFFTGEMIQDSTEEATAWNVSAPLNSTIPLFIRGGAIVHQQDVEDVLTTNDLNDNFILLAALLPINGDEYKLSASGTIMSLSNYSDENIIVKCQLRNCLLDITVNVSFSGNTPHSTVSVVAQDPTNNLEPVNVSQVQLYGVVLPGSSKVIVRHNGELIEDAFVGTKEGSTQAVIYLPDLSIKHGDVIDIIHDF